jgi:hypothetical protein
VACSPPHTHDPLPKMGGERVEVQIQAVAGEDREAPWRQPPSEVVDHRMRGSLGPRAGYPLGDAAPGSAC